MLTDPELDGLERKRVVLYQKLSDISRKHKETSTEIKVQIYETEQRIAAIFRGDR